MLENKHYSLERHKKEKKSMLKIQCLFVIYPSMATFIKTCSLYLVLFINKFNLVQN